MEKEALQSLCPSTDAMIEKLKQATESINEKHTKKE
jgi:hypothetical protein